MSETLETLLNRRSVRTYKSDQISDHDLNTILEAGKFAPSAMNHQDWHFTVVQNKEVLQKISQLTKVLLEKSEVEAFRQRAKAANFSICYNAPTYIIVSESSEAIAPQADSALALGNLFLAADAIGISSCWIHAISFFNGTEEGTALFKELGIPEGFIPQCSGAFGYNSAVKPAPAPRKEGTVNIIR